MRWALFKLFENQLSLHNFMILDFEKKIIIYLVQNKRQKNTFLDLYT